MELYTDGQPSRFGGMFCFKRRCDLEMSQTNDLAAYQASALPSGGDRMPVKPLRPCRHPMCPKLTDAGYCEEHKRAERKRYDDKRGSAASRGYNGQWRKVRGIKLKRNPLCERCRSRGRTVAATMVHHIVAIRKGGAAYDVENLMSVCVGCHDEIHREQGDKW